MPTFRGDITNPAPNNKQEPIALSEKLIVDNRALHIRRDTDTQEDFTVGFYDIDNTILTQLEQFQLQVTDAGKQIKVPIFYGSPEKWVSSNRDGYLRDKQGKIILPAIIFKRTNSESDSTLPFFNRYLEASVLKRYTEKNKYTKFSLVTGNGSTTNEVYNVVIPNHMVLTYHFIVWTEYVEQMNKLIETIQFNTRDYWGTEKGFKFRTKIESYAHTVELDATEDRIVKSEFDLSLNGYILPDTMTKLTKHTSNTNKFFTPKKFVIGLETMTKDVTSFDKNREKWKNPNYPNLQTDVPISSPDVTINTNIINGGAIGIKVDNSPLFLRIVPVPITQAAGGQNGDMSYDSQYFYFYSDGWKRVAIAQFVPNCDDAAPAIGNEGSVTYNRKYFYIYSSGLWRKVAISEVNFTTSGNDGDVMYDTGYFYIYTSGSWKRVAISTF